MKNDPPSLAIWSLDNPAFSSTEVILHPRRVENRMEHHFIGLLEKVHRPTKNPKTLRLQVAIKVFLGIPFLKKTKLILILHTLEKVAPLASLFRPYGADQGRDRL